MSNHFLQQTFRTYVSCGYSFRPYAQRLGERAQQVWGEEALVEQVGRNLAIECSFRTSSNKPLEITAQVLKEALKAFDHTHLNEGENSVLGAKAPTLENIALKVRDELLAQLSKVIAGGSELTRLRVVKNKTHWVDLECNESSELGSVRPRVTRVYKINCLHRHHNPDLSQEENEELYTKCSRTHGHEYKIELTLAGDMVPETGSIYEALWLDSLMNEHVLLPLHGSYLNDHLGNTSGEIILEKLRLRLAPLIPSHLDLSLRLRETRKNSFLSFNYPLETI